MSWRTIESEGRTWEVRAVAGCPGPGEDVLEFRAPSGDAPPRRVMVPTGALATMDDAGLAAAFAQSRPLGGDHYGRPGKRMQDVR